METARVLGTVGGILALARERMPVLVAESQKRRADLEHGSDAYGQELAALASERLRPSISIESEIPPRLRLQGPQASAVVYLEQVGEDVVLTLAAPKGSRGEILPIWKWLVGQFAAAPEEEPEPEDTDGENRPVEDRARQRFWLEWDGLDSGQQGKYKELAKLTRGIDAKSERAFKREVPKFWETRHRKDPVPTNPMMHWAWSWRLFGDQRKN